MKPLVTNFRLLPGGRWHLGLVVCTVHRLIAGRRFEVAQRLTEPADEETTAWKPGTDVVVRGSVYASGAPKREVSAVVEMGPHRAMIRATGDRIIEGFSSGRPVFSTPREFECMRLEATRAYGGFDRGAYERVGDSFADESVRMGAELDSSSRFTYPRNRRGCGYAVSLQLERLLETRVPNLDYPDDPVTPERLIRESAHDWVDAPRPVLLDWVEPTDFPRAAHWRVLHPVARVDSRRLSASERALLEPADLEEGGVAPVTSPRALNGSLLGLTGLRVEAGAELRLTNLHREHAEVFAHLPADRPGLRMRPPGCFWFDLEPQLDTIVLDVDEDTLRMVWTGKLEVAGRYPDDEVAEVETEVRWL
jgi:hypothetical protein